MCEKTKNKKEADDGTFLKNPNKKSSNSKAF